MEAPGVFFSIDLSAEKEKKQTDAARAILTKGPCKNAARVICDARRSIPLSPGGPRRGAGRSANQPVRLLAVQPR
jgi:hypothetical protein